MKRSVPPVAAIISVVGVLLGVHLLAAAANGPQQPQPQVTFRASVTAVPLDVRVLDRDGKPVTDLKREDFSVFEDDVRQPVGHFFRQQFVAGQPGPAVRANSMVPSFEADGPPQHRVFLIVVGAGALGTKPLLSVSPSGSVHGPRTVQADPSKALDGLLHLLRDRLLPQDQVALFAFGRATDFSPDHESMAKVLEAFKQSEEDGIAALTRRASIHTASADEESLSASNEAGSGLSQSDLGFAEYVAARQRPANDLGNLHYGIKYLRYIDGEKHLIYVTARGLVQPMTGTLENQTPGVWETPEQLAAVATDARVALHVIQTGGMSSGPGDFLPPLPVMTPSIMVPGQAYFGKDPQPPGGGGSGGAPKSSLPMPGWDPMPGLAEAGAAPIPGLSATTVQALTDLRTVARLTGGHASIAKMAVDAVERIDEQTRVDYVLAYYPSNSASDGRYRAVRVEVNRPDVTVLFRHGYHALRPDASISRRTVVTEGRLSAALVSTKEVREIELSVTPAFVADKTRKGGEMTVRMVIDGSRLAWTADDLSRRVTHLDVGVFCADSRQKLIGRATRALDITLTEQRFAQLAGKGLPYSVRIPLTTSARYVKVIVYNYEANVLGSRIVRMK